MRILSRCSEIFVANINSLLDKVESPEAMFGQVLREMEDGLAVARGHAANAIAAERWLGRELAKQREEIESWQAKARDAVSANRDDLARLALRRKKELERSATEIGKQHTAALETSAQARAALDAMEANLAAALSKQRSLVARHRAAQARRALCRAAGKSLGASPSLSAKLQHWDQRMSLLEDEIAAEGEVQGLGAIEPVFATWEADCEIERELSALKSPLTPNP